MGDSAGATRWYHKVLDIDPGHRQARLNLGVLVCVVVVMCLFVLMLVGA